MTHRRSGATALLVLVLGVTGCTSSGGGSGADGEPSPSDAAASTIDESTATAADDAATAYVTGLRRYQRQLDRAATLSARATKADSAPQWQAAQRLFRGALDKAPTLAEVEDGAEGSEAYARAVQVAERAQGFIDEHEWMTRWDIKEETRVHSALYILSSEQFTGSIRLRSAYERALAGPGDSLSKRKPAMRNFVSGQLADAAKARKKLERLAGKDSFTPSLRDHLLYELDEKLAVGQRFLEYVKTTPAVAIDRDLFRNAFLDGDATSGGAVANAPVDRTVLLRRLLAQGVGRLVQHASTGQGELPWAGDIYRQVIKGLFVPSRARNWSDRSIAVGEQLYWLWHVREIEDTPDEAFEDARLTIKLQNQPSVRGSVAINVDSRFDELAAISTVLKYSIETPSAGAPNKPWLIEMLARPFPPILDEPVTLARESADLMPESADETASPEVLALGNPLFKALTKAADTLDNTKRFRKAFDAAIDGTRPSDG